MAAKSNWSTSNTDSLLASGVDSSAGAPDSLLWQSSQGGGGQGFGPQGVGMSPARAGTHNATNIATDIRADFIVLTPLNSGVNTTIATKVALAAHDCWERADYEGEKQALGNYWPPDPEGSEPDILFEQGVLLTSLSRDLSLAKDLLSKAVRLYGDHPKQAWAQIALAVAYWTGGEYKEARTILSGVHTTDYEYCRLMAHAVFELTDDPEEALSYLDRAEPLVERQSIALRGRFHNHRGMALRKLADGKPKAEAGEFRQRSELEYLTALEYFGQAEAAELKLAVLNNLSGLYLASENYQAAHELVDSVRGKFADAAHQGKSDDQKANIFLQEKQFAQATHVASRAVALLETTPRQAWLAEALITYGCALVGSGEYINARVQFERAAAICEHTGDDVQAGRSYIAMIRNLPLVCEEAFLVFARVPEGSRLDAIEALTYRLEAEAIRIALDRAKGSVLLAARQLKISRQALEKKIFTHFPQFLNRSKRKRRKSVLSSHRN